MQRNEKNGTTSRLTQSENKLLPIGQAARQAGVSRQSLQYYLMVGLLEASRTTATGRRFFDRNAIERIRLIKQLNASGYTLRAIRELFLDDSKLPKGNNL